MDTAGTRIDIDPTTGATRRTTAAGRRQERAWKDEHDARNRAKYEARQAAARRSSMHATAMAELRAEGAEGVLTDEQIDAKIAEIAAR